MCPLLRGDASPLPNTELARLRDELERGWGHDSVPTPSGPLLVVRVPTDRPDLLQDLEAATDHLPPMELTGYRGAILVGDQSHLAVSIDMLHSLVSARRATEDNWIAQHRHHLQVGGFVVVRLPSDAERRLRAVIRVAQTRVAELGESDFDELAALLPRIKAQSPGQCRPAFTYLVAQEDHVRIEGARFFSELEERARRIQDRKDRAAKQKRESSYELALGHIARLEEQKKRAGTDPTAHRTSANRYQRRHASVSPPMDIPPSSRTPSRTSSRGTSSPLDRPTVSRERERPSPPPVVRSPVSDPRTTPIDAPPAPASSTRHADPRFRAAERHASQLEHLKGILGDAGYEVRERLVVDDVPLALAAARPEGYPRRVLVTFHDRLEAEMARRILRVARGAGAELALAITDDSGEGVDRVTLATNLKVIAPEAVKGMRLD